MKGMKGSMWLLVLLVCASSVSFAQESAGTEERQVVDEIIAKVNGAIITRSDLEQERLNLRSELARSDMTQAEQARVIEDSEPRLLENKIDDLLLVQKGEELEIDVEPEVTRYMADIMLKANIAEQDEFADLVASQTGMPYEDFRQQVRDGMMAQRVLGQEVASRIIIPMEDVREYYEQHKEDFIRDERLFLREILISTESRTDAEALEKAEEIVQRARKAERFEDLAKEESDAYSAPDGGLLDPVEKGDLLPELEAAVWDKERNYVTDPLKVPNGYLILKVDEHHAAGQASLDEVEQEIMGILHDPMFQPKVREYLTQLRQDAFLEIKDGWADLGAAPGKDTSWTDPAELTPPTVTRQEVYANPGKKKALWMFPIPGTSQGPVSVSR